ncbi:MAG: pentapeptide repeat-containing protein [Leptolyngbya sp. SIO1D8]|nr:pentapeptide repeat-containing protein [Leptolyngbya sp. SIO1D8]
MEQSQGSPKVDVLSQGINENKRTHLGDSTHAQGQPVTVSTSASSTQVTNGQETSLEDAAEALLANTVNPPTAPSPSKSPPAAVVILVGLLLMTIGISLNLTWLMLLGARVNLVLSWGLMWPSLQGLLAELSPQQRSLLIALPAFFIGLFGFMQAVGINGFIQAWGRTVRWEIVGALGDFLGALGQILVAMLALYVAWRQYVISRDLTVQQNRITQQQTIDAYFQGISELVLDDEGLLEDWPQERIIAEARTAAILSSVDSPGKAKVIRFLSRSKLLTPLQRDRHLGRPILDGSGGYAEDRPAGLRVINLGAMLANADLSRGDLRWTDLSDTNLIRANLAHCDLVRANFSRTILYHANLSEADLMGVRFFYGVYDVASPRSRTNPPDFSTGACTGAVVEGANFSGAKRLSEEQRQYCCRWGGASTRATIPGGCEGIPNCLEKTETVQEH